MEETLGQFTSAKHKGNQSYEPLPHLTRFTPTLYSMKDTMLIGVDRRLED